ncbi:MAG: hypothetical protein R3Y67_04235 [Eubacteriales bacterium]
MKEQFKKIIQVPWNVAILILTIILVIQLVLTTVAFIDLHSDFNISYSEETYLWNVKEANYIALLYKINNFDFDKFENNANVMECYYIGKYYESAIYYHAYDPDSERGKYYANKLEEYSEHVVTFAYTLDEINELFDIP